MSDYTHGHNIKVDGTVESTKQGMMLGAMDVMPTASAEWVGRRVMYSGTDVTTYYKTGMWYVCREAWGGYVWKPDWDVRQHLDVGGVYPPCPSNEEGPIQMWTQYGVAHRTMKGHNGEWHPSYNTLHAVMFEHDIMGDGVTDTFIFPLDDDISMVVTLPIHVVGYTYEGGSRKYVVLGFEVKYNGGENPTLLKVTFFDPPALDSEWIIEAVCSVRDISIG